MESAWVSARGYISKLQRMRHDSIKNEQVMSHTTAGRSNSRTHQIERSELGSLGGTLIKTCCYSYGGCPPNPRARFARFNLADDTCDPPALSLFQHSSFNDDGQSHKCHLDISILPKSRLQPSPCCLSKGERPPVASRMFHVAPLIASIRRILPLIWWN